MFQNIYADGIKKLLFEVLKQKYSEHELTIDRMANNINNPKDYELIGKLLVAIYETAYMKAVEEHREVLSKYGMNVEIIAKKPIEEKDKIFKKN